MTKTKYELLAMHGTNGRTYSITNLLKIEPNFMKQFVEASLNNELSEGQSFYTKMIKISDKKDLNVAELVLTITGTDFVENFKNNIYTINDQGKINPEETYIQEEYRLDHIAKSINAIVNLENNKFIKIGTDKKIINQERVKDKNPSILEYNTLEAPDTIYRTDDEEILGMLKLRD